MRADGGIDVTLSVPGVRVRSGSCVDVPFTVKHDAGYLDRFTAEVEVWRGQQFVTDTFDYVYESSGPLRGSFSHCVYRVTDLGNFRLGPSRGEFNDYEAGIDGTYRDGSVKGFKILQHSRFSPLSVTRSGRTRRATAALAYFDAGVNRFMFAPSGLRVLLQRRLPDGSWSTDSSGRVGNRGRVAVSVGASEVRSYRFLSGTTTRTWGAVSAVVRR